MYKLNKLTAAIVLSSITIVTGCGGDSDTTADPKPPSTISLSGSGVKGPMAGANVLAYGINTSNPNLKGTIIDEGATDSRAQIVDLTLPTPQSTSVLLEIIADTDTTDITTGLSPVITQLKTVVTPSMLATEQVIFATPFTSVAVDLAVANADKSNALYSGNSDGLVSEVELLAALPIAASQVKSALGFGLLDDIDIFATAPLVTNSQTTSDALAQVAAYRTAIEALSAVILNIRANMLANNSSSALTNDDVLSAIALDLSDGDIDGKNSEQAIAAFSDVVDIVSLIMVDPSTLKIPGTDIPVTDVESILAAEITITGTSANISALQDGSINVTPSPARVNSDIDGDGVTDRYDAFPKNPKESLDTDNDGIGNNADTDDDNDGIEDAADNCPLVVNTDQKDLDQNGIGDSCQLITTGIFDISKWDDGSTFK